MVIIIYLVQDPATAWEITQARELIKKRAIERTGFLDTCDKISSRLLAIFRAHKDSPQFQFILIDKQGASDMKQATAIIHSTDADSATEIEKKLKIPYNI